MTDVFDVLLSELRASRANGQPFSRAWNAAKIVALRDLDPRERKNWLAVLEGTCWAWQRSYLGEPRMPSEAVVARLFALRDAVYT